MKKINIKKNSRKDLNILIDKSMNFLITIEKNAELNLITKFDSKKILNNSFKIILKENAKLNHDSLYFGKNSANSSFLVLLKGKNSRFNNNNLIFGNLTQKIDFKVDVIHESPYTYSNILTKCALNNKANMNYNGLIKINKNAHDSDGYQKQESILLSEDAVSNSIPKLEIDNNEVQCAHNISFSNIDEEKLFYLMSRGLDEKKAKYELIKGFFDVLLAKINFKNEDMQNMVQEKIK